MKRAIITIDGMHRFEVEWECDHEDCRAEVGHAIGEARMLLDDLKERITCYLPKRRDAIDFRIEEVKR
jgi:hypothetical protein